MRLGIPARRGGDIRCNDWKAQMHGLVWFIWSESQYGTMCWWIPSRNTTAGWHDEGQIFGWTAEENDGNINQTGDLDWAYHCGDSSSNGIAVDTQSCELVKRDCDDCKAGWMLSGYDYFKVTAVASGLPFGREYGYHVNLHATGNVTGYRDN